MIVHEGDYESRRGIYCDNCHCGDCEAARFEEDWDDALLEQNRRFPLHRFPLNQFDQMIRNSAQRMAEAMFNATPDPNCPMNTAFILTVPEDS